MPPPSPLLRLLGATLALLGGCATPLRPSGGPEDRTPPQLVAAAPAAGAVNVRTDRLVLTFSERLDEASAQRALTVAPAFDRPPAVRVSGRELTVLFPDSLRPRTTYVVTFGTELRDLHGAALAAPLTVAFATGAQLDRGQIAGAVRDPDTDAGVAGLSVFAYRLADTTDARLPDPRTTAPDYRTQTGTGGAFTLSYLREGAYFVAAVEDRDRDGRADASERFAAPPTPTVQTVAVDPVQTAAADTGRTAARDSSRTLRGVLPQDSPLQDAPSPSAPALALYVARLDTTAPTLRAARALTSRRIAARFDEAVSLTETGGAAWTVADSASGRAVPVEAVYGRPGEPREVVVVTAVPTGPGRHRLRLTAPGAVRDSSGTAAVAQEASFSASAAPDTARARFAGFLPASQRAADSTRTLRPGERPGVRFTLPLDSAAVRARLAARDAQGAAIPFALEAEGPLAYRLRLPPGSGVFTLEVQDADTARARFSPLGPDELGSLSGRVEAGRGLVVEAFAGGSGAGGSGAGGFGVGRPAAEVPRFVARADAAGAFALRDLPPGEYRLRVFADANGNGRWDGGALAPYAPPEPLRWLEAPVRVRARWEAEVEGLVLGDGGSPPAPPR